MRFIDPAVSWTIALSVAGLLATAAVHKLRDRAAFREVVRNYRLLPQRLVPLVAAVLIVLELAAAALVLPAATRPLGAVLAAALLFGYATAMAINLGRGRVNLDCGCLGVGRRDPIRWWMVGRNLVIGVLVLIAGQPLMMRELTPLDALTIVCASVSLAFLYAAQNVLGAAARPLVR